MDKVYISTLWYPCTPIVYPFFLIQNWSWGFSFRGINQNIHKWRFNIKFKNREIRKCVQIYWFLRITLIMYRICTCTDFVQYSFLFETDLDLIPDIKWRSNKIQNREFRKLVEIYWFLQLLRSKTLTNGKIAEKIPARSSFFNFDCRRQPPRMNFALAAALRDDAGGCGDAAGCCWWRQGCCG